MLTATSVPGSVPLPRKLDGLQVGRAFAALSVVLGHSVAYADDGTALGIWHLCGRYGVTLFFVISGFIMVHTTGSGSFDPRRFMGNRLRRVVPIYLIANLVLLVLVLAVPSVFRHTRIDLGHILLSLLFIPSYAPGSDGIWPFFRLGWTLNFEMFFYVVFASLFFLKAFARVVAMTLFFGLLIILGQLVQFHAAIPRFYTQIDTLGFVAGAWLGILALAGAFRPRPLFMAIMLVASCAAFVVLGVEMHAIRFQLMTQVAVIAMCMVHIALLISFVDTVPVRVSPGLIYIGDASYSLYLFHMFAIGFFTAMTRKLPAFMAYPMVGASVIGAVLSGILIYRFIETPLNQRMRKNGRPLTAGQIDESAEATRPLTSQ
jgi:exopolysaccharide production protein ExoZ